MRYVLRIANLNGDISTQAIDYDESELDFCSEVHALEHLVDRYQHELCNTNPRRKRSDVDDPIEMDDILYENQILNLTNWLDQRIATGVPHYTSKTGECCSFGEITLPSSYWQWINDWRLEIDQNTDEEGWVYGQCWKHLLQHDTSQWNNKRSAHDTVRRRVWKRKRVYTGKKRVIEEQNKYLIYVDSNVKLKHVNQKLTDQLLIANSRLMDYENRIKFYESKLEYLYTSHGNLCDARTCDESTNVEIEDVDSPSDNMLQRSRELQHEKTALEDGTEEPPSTEEYERKHSAIVEQCETELNNAFRELRALTNSTLKSEDSTAFHTVHSGEQVVAEKRNSSCST